MQTLTPMCMQTGILAKRKDVGNNTLSGVQELLMCDPDTTPQRRSLCPLCPCDHSAGPLPVLPCEAAPAGTAAHKMSSTAHKATCRVALCKRFLHDVLSLQPLQSQTFASLPTTMLATMQLPSGLAQAGIPANTVSWPQCSTGTQCWRGMQVWAEGPRGVRAPRGAPRPARPRSLRLRPRRPRLPLQPRSRRPQRRPRQVPRGRPLELPGHADARRGPHEPLRHAGADGGEHDA